MRDSVGSLLEGSEVINQRRYYPRRPLRISVYFLLLVNLLLSSSLAQDLAKGPQEVTLKELVPRLRENRKLVGLAAMVMVDGKVVDSAVDGVRLSGNRAKLTIDDRWHIGSITKSVTSTLIARLVGSGVMAWTDTIGEGFANADVHVSWKPVTLRQLLTHTSGAPANFSVWVRLRHPARGSKRMAARKKAVLQVLKAQVSHAPGEKFEYSNVGYTIAGAMAENATGKLWEARSMDNGKTWVPRVEFVLCQPDNTQLIKVFRVPVANKKKSRNKSNIQSIPPALALPATSRAHSQRTVVPGCSAARTGSQRQAGRS